MHRRALVGAGSLLALPRSGWAQLSASADVSNRPPPLRILTFEGLTPVLAQNLDRGQRLVLDSTVQIENTDRSTSLEAIQQRLRQWLAAPGSEAVPVALLPTQHWLGLGLLRPQLAIAPEAFAPLASLYTLPAALGVHAALGARSSLALSERLRERPHQLPAAVWGWASPAHWLAMLWVHAMGVPLRWRFPPDHTTLGQWMREGRSAIVFGTASYPFGMPETRSLMPIAFWTAPGKSPPGSAVSGHAVAESIGRMPDPCAVMALVPRAWLAANAERAAMARDWFARVMQTHPMSLQARLNGWHDASNLDVSALQDVANRQLQAFAAIAAHRLEGGRS